MSFKTKRSKEFLEVNENELANFPSLHIALLFSCVCLCLLEMFNRNDNYKVLVESSKRPMINHQGAMGMKSLVMISQDENRQL